jgi:hypothetical protein
MASNMALGEKKIEEMAERRQLLMRRHHISWRSGAQRRMAITISAAYLNGIR